MVYTLIMEQVGYQPNISEEEIEMQTLNRDKKTGDYYSVDRKYFIEKGTIGWNVSELNEARSKAYGYYVYEYIFSCETLREVRESI